MVLAMVGASFGRADVTAPSLTWAGIAFGGLVGAYLVWIVAWRVRCLLGHPTCRIAAGIPLLATADGWIVTAFHYLHEPTNHLLTVGLATTELHVRPAVTEWLAVKFVVLALLWVAWPWLAAREPAREGSSPDASAGDAFFKAHPAASGGLAVVGIVAALAYLRLAFLDVLDIENPSDLRVNYVGALALREGLNPYDNAVALQVAGREGIPYVGTRLWSMVTNPPTAMLYFVPYSAMPLAAASVAFLVVNHIALLATAALTWRMARPALPPAI